MSLPLVTRFGADPLLDLEVANKRYVDNSSGGTGQTFARVVKSVDDVINSDTTLQDDSELKFTPNINKTYQVTLWLFYQSGSTPDIKIAMAFPSGATGFRHNSNFNLSANATTSWTTAQQPGTNGALQWQPFTGFVIMGATAGDINIQFAQRISDAGDTTMKQGSLLVAWEQL